MRTNSPKVMRLVSHEQRIGDMAYPLSHNCGGTFSEPDVSYWDMVVVVNPDAFVCAVLDRASKRRRSARDRVVASFAQGTRAIDVYMWPDEFEKTFGYSIYQIRKETEE